MSTAEALKMAIRFARINPHVGMYENRNSNHVIYGAELAKLFESALSELEKREPSAYTDYYGKKLTFEKTGFPLYTAPISKEWVGLSNDNVLELESKFTSNPFKNIRAVEAKLKELNHE